MRWLTPLRAHTARRIAGARGRPVVHRARSPKASAENCPTSRSSGPRQRRTDRAWAGSATFVDCIRQTARLSTLSRRLPPHQAADPRQRRREGRDQAHEGDRGQGPATPQVLGGNSQGASVIDMVDGVQIGGVGWRLDSGEEREPCRRGATFGDLADRSGGTIPAQSSMPAPRPSTTTTQLPDLPRGPRQRVEWAIRRLRPRHTTQAASFVTNPALLAALPTAPQAPMGRRRPGVPSSQPASRSGAASPARRRRARPRPWSTRPSPSRFADLDV